jgi:hypothetical protein
MPVMPFPSMQQHRPPQAHDVMHPTPFPGPIALSSSMSPRHTKFVMPSNPHHPWARNAIILPKPTRLHCIFFIVILGLWILILICYIATLLWYATLLLFCCIALMCYLAKLLWYATLSVTNRIALICCIAFFMLHCFDMLHCHIALICYITTFHWYATLLLFGYIALMCYIATFLWYTTLPLTCRIALICYIAFDMLHCFDMLHSHIAQWWKWLSETSVATWTNIIVLLRFHLQTTCNK